MSNTLSQTEVSHWGQELGKRLSNKCVLGTERLHCRIQGGITFRKLVPVESERGVSVDRLPKPVCALTEHPTVEDRL